jgi:hypothetical protein
VIAPANTAPVANDDAYGTDEDTPLSVAAPGVLQDDTDAEHDALTAALVSGPVHGALILNGDGSFSYTPAADHNGPDSFTYRASDGLLDSNVATVGITVRAVNDAPTVSVAPGGVCGTSYRDGTINLTLADVDNPAGALTLTAVSSDQTLVPNGNIAFGGAGAARTLRATAVMGRTGIAILTVTVSDGQAMGTVQVTVRAAGNGEDVITGGGGADMIFGQNGGDSLSGAGGIDLLCGGHGGDTLTGGPGADRFSGGAGTDIATDLNATEGDTQDGTIP